MPLTATSDSYKTDFASLGTITSTMNPLTARRFVRQADHLGRCLRLVSEEAWIRDLSWRFVYANPSFVRFLDTPLRHVEGRFDVDFFSVSDSAGFRRDDHLCARARRPISFFETPTAEEGPHETLKLPLIVGGEVVGVIGIACPVQPLRDAGPPPAWLLRVKSEIAASFTTRPMIQRLARRAGVHPDHLGRSFKLHFGLSVHDFVRRLRIQWCSWSLLAEADRPLGDLAVAAGFSDQSHLTREYARIRGVTPGHDRERWRVAVERGADSSQTLSSLTAAAPSAARRAAAGPRPRKARPGEP